MIEMNELIKDELWESIEKLHYLFTSFPLWEFCRDKYFTSEDHVIRQQLPWQQGENSLSMIDNTFYLFILCAEGEDIC
jgi:hypothetical protein